MMENLTWLKKNEAFHGIMEKISRNIQLNYNELVFALSCSILFMKEYERDKRKNINFQLAYFIVVKISIIHNYYQPLLDISTNVGFYPISRYIIKNELIEVEKISNIILDYNLENFNFGGIIETYEQNKYREELVCSNSLDNCYVAPTSFGKSSLIIEILKNNIVDKSAIIVPTKSLLVQTHKLIRRNFPELKVIFHDEMYNSDKKFIAVLTQERALRLIKKNIEGFDLIVIDEAHNLFEKDNRTILLTRLIRKNRLLKKQSKNYYLSPLISDSENLKFDKNQTIFNKKILTNLKEPDIYEYRINGEVYKYNRFIDHFFIDKFTKDYKEYIIKNSERKNFIFLTSPKKVEIFTSILSKDLPLLNNKDLDEISLIISNNVHKDFYCVEYIKKGVLYLHGKLPDLIKEYLEHKFSTSENIKYIVSNSVILEGINLPIDSLFILNVHGLNVKDLVNLIGRVNRLNEVFNDKWKSLFKLLPKVHFVNTEAFNRKNGKMENKIRLLKNQIFKDEVKNPILLNFNGDLKTAEGGNTNNIENSDTNLVKQREDFLIYGDDTPSNKIKKVLIEASIHTIYHDFDAIYDDLLERIYQHHKRLDWEDIHVIDKIYEIFIKDFLSNLNSFRNGFFRLQHIKARDFYKGFVDKSHKLILKDRISDMLSFFHSKKNNNDRLLFIGDSYGEISKDNNTRKSYIDLGSKSDKELVNLALIKIKLESDFVSFVINDFVNVLYELNLIKEDEYNLHIYGTINKDHSEFIRIGISGSLINKLNRDNQIKNISIDYYGSIIANTNFFEYLAKQDDLIRFEMEKYLSI